MFLRVAFICQVSEDVRFGIRFCLSFDSDYKFWGFRKAQNKLFWLCCVWCRL